MLKKLLTSGNKKSSSDKPVPFVEEDPHKDDRYMNLAVNAHNWQVAWRITAAILAISVAQNGYYMMQSKFVPVVIEVDELGQTVVIGEVTKSKPIDSERVLMREMSDFIKYSRSVTGDLNLQKSWSRWVAQRMPDNGSASRLVKELYAARDPYKTSQSGTYSIEIKSVLRQSKETYEVEWIEIQRKLSGEIIGQERWRALMSYTLQPSDTLEGIRNNPVGMYITELSWTRRN